MRRPYVDMTGQWPLGTTPTFQTLRRLDQFSSELVNGEEGGLWTPSSPITIGLTPVGEDTYVRLNTGAPSLVSGDVETVKGNNAQPADGVRRGIILSDAGTPAPTLETAISRTIDVSFLNWTESKAVGSDSDVYVAEPAFALDTDLLCPRGVMGQDGKEYPVIGSVPAPHRVHHFGSRLASVTFYFAIGSHPGTSVPTNKVGVRVIRVDDAGTGVKMHTTSGSYSASGFLVDPTTSADTYFSKGNVRTLTFVPDQFNTALATDKYFYFLQWMDDDRDVPANGKGNAFLGARIVIDEISTMRTQ